MMGQPPAITVSGTGLDTLKGILLWLGWIIMVVACICLFIDYIMCKNMGKTAEENYTRADAVREKVLGELRTAIKEYNEATGESISTGEDKDDENKDDENKDDKNKDDENKQ
jgi:hypothetical protein